MARRVSLSWLVVSCRHYIKECNWYLNRDSGYSYGCPKEDGKEGLYRYKDVNNLEPFVLMPELQDLSIEEASFDLRIWCENNDILYNVDLDNYEAIERGYWGYDDNERRVVCFGNQR